MTRISYRIGGPGFSAVYTATSDESALTAAGLLADLMVGCPLMTDGVVVNETEDRRYAVSADGIVDLCTGAIERRAA